jgi:hypothetical protein
VEANITYGVRRDRSRLGVSDDVVRYRLCAPTYKDQHTNRQALRAVHLPKVLRFQVEMHIQCGTVEVGQVGEEKAHMAVTGGRMLRRAS